MTNNTQIATLIETLNAVVSNDENPMVALDAIHSTAPQGTSRLIEAFIQSCKDFAELSEDQVDLIERAAYELFDMSEEGSIDPEEGKVGSDPEPILWKFEVEYTNIKWDVKDSPASYLPASVSTYVTWWSDDVSTLEETVKFKLNNMYGYSVDSFEFTVTPV